MILFSQRYMLGKLFEQHCEENKLANCPENVVTWLYSMDLLDEEKVEEFLKDKGMSKKVSRQNEGEKHEL